MQVSVTVSCDALGAANLRELANLIEGGKASKKRAKAADVEDDDDDEEESDDDEDYADDDEQKKNPQSVSGIPNGEQPR